MNLKFRDNCLPTITTTFESGLRATVITFGGIPTNVSIRGSHESKWRDVWLLLNFAIWNIFKRRANIIDEVIPKTNNPKSKRSEGAVRAGSTLYTVYIRYMDLLIYASLRGLLRLLTSFTPSLNQELSGYAIIRDPRSLKENELIKRTRKHGS